MSSILAPRFYMAPPWRWLVTEWDTGRQLTFLDRLTDSAEVVYGLDAPARATLMVPSGNPEVNILNDETDPEPFVAEGRRNLIGLRREGGAYDFDGDGRPDIWVPRYTGRILNVEDVGDTEDAMTRVVAYDGWQLAYKRPVRDVYGNVPSGAGFTINDTAGSVIAAEALANTIAFDGSIGIDAGPLYGGTIYWEGTIDATEVKARWPVPAGQMLGELWDALVLDGSLDIVLTPVYDPIRRPGIIADLSIVAQAGTTKPEAMFDWDVASRNLSRISRMADGTARANTISYWRSQGITYVAPAPYIDGDAIDLYGSYWAQQAFPSSTTAAAAALAALQLRLRAFGVETIELTPMPGKMPLMFEEWWMGDNIPVAATARLREAFSGYTRVVGARVTMDADSMEQVPQLLVGAGTA